MKTLIQGDNERSYTWQLNPHPIDEHYCPGYSLVEIEEDGKVYWACFKCFSAWPARHFRPKAIRVGVLGDGVFDPEVFEQTTALSAKPISPKVWQRRVRCHEDHEPESRRVGHYLGIWVYYCTSGGQVVFFTTPDRYERIRARIKSTTPD